MEVSRQLHTPAALPQVEGLPAPLYHWTRCWVGSRAGLDTFLISLKSVSILLFCSAA